MPFPHKMMEKKQAHVPSPGSQIPPPVKKDATRYTSGPKFSILNAIQPISSFLLPNSPINKNYSLSDTAPSVFGLVLELCYANFYSNFRPFLIKGFKSSVDLIEERILIQQLRYFYNF